VQESAVAQVSDKSRLVSQVYYYPNLEALYGHGWPRNADNRRYFHLKPYGRVYTAFVKGEVALNSKYSRDLPTPGSAIAATICPCPSRASSAACLSASISRSQGLLDAP
jgi:hypothetical protein